MPGREAQSPGTHHPFGFGGSGRKLGGPRHPGRRLRVGTARPSLLPSLAAAAALTDTPPPPPAPTPHTGTRQILTGQMADAREIPGGRADPPGLTPPHPSRAPVAEGGCGRRVAAWRSRSGRDSPARSVLAHTHSLGMRLTFSPRPPLPGDPQPPSWPPWGPLLLPRLGEGAGPHPGP